jgi:hypothetical protein
MKNVMLRSLSVLGIPLMMALSATAQEQPKVKVTNDEYKYKSDDVKIKATEDEGKYKSRDVKVKETEDESKYKSENLKVKETEDERKVKAKVTPMRPTSTERTVIKTGETQVRTKEHILPLTSPEPQVPATTTPAIEGQVAVPKTAATVKKPAAKKYAATKSTTRKRTTARKPATATKYIVREKVVRDTVYVPSPPETIVARQTEYVRDTVVVTRVDTVVKTQVANTYGGYRVPAGDFKKVKLKKDKDGEVWMKRKE